MPERPFVIISSAWLYDRALQGCSAEAYKLFVSIYQCSDEHGRYTDDPLVIKGEGLALRPEVRVAQVTRWRDELVLAGCLIYRNSLDGRRWLEIADHLRYRKGQHRDPRWGVPPAPEPRQAELPMGPLVSLPPPAGAGIPVRVEKSRQETSKRARAPELPAPGGGDVTREDELLAHIAALCGFKETIRNGGLWRIRIRENTQALRNALEDFQVRTPEQKGAIHDKAAWLTDRYQRCRAEMETQKAVL